MSAYLYQKVHVAENASTATFSFTAHGGGLTVGFSKSGDLLLADYSLTLDEESARSLLRTLTAMLGGE